MGFLLLIPFLLIRFGLLTILNKAAVKRADHFPPLKKMKRLRIGRIRFPRCRRMYFHSF